MITCQKIVKVMYSKVQRLEPENIWHLCLKNNDESILKSFNFLSIESINHQTASAPESHQFHHLLDKELLPVL